MASSEADKLSSVAANYRNIRQALRCRAGRFSCFDRAPGLLAAGLLAVAVSAVGASPASGLRISPDASVANGFRLVWPTVPGESYALQEADEPDEGRWADSDGYPAEAAWLAQNRSVEVGASAPERRFFRVEARDTGGGRTENLRNMGFEFPVNDGTPPFAAPADWRVFGGLFNSGVIHQSNRNIPPAPEGSQWVFLSSGDAPGGVTQPVGTAVGDRTYLLSFAVGDNAGTGRDLPAEMEVMLQIETGPDSTRNFGETVNLADVVGENPGQGVVGRVSVEITLPSYVGETEVAGLPLALVLRIGDAADTQVLLDDVRISPTEETTHPRKRPNVVVILSDDQREQDLGRNGHPVLTTPELDSLASEGVYFTEAFVTSAACTPSRNSIFLGEWERKHGVTFNSQSALTEEAFARSYPMRLRRAGYYTGYVGKNHSPIGKTDRGFGYESGVIERMFDFWYGNHKHTGFYPKGRHPIYNNATADTQVEILEEGAMDFLDVRPADRPFCLLVNFNVPHSGGTRDMERRESDPDIYDTLYRDRIDEFPVPPNFVAAAEIDDPKIPTNVFSGDYIPSYDYAKTRPGLREHMVREAQTIHGVDRMVGNLRDALEAKGVADNTIIVYLSDHGIQHGEFGLRGKVLLYEPSVRIPMLIHDPRMPEGFSGREIDEFALNVDVAPTILDLCGLEVPASMQGRSLVPLMRGDPVAWREDFFLENLFFARENQPYPRMEAVRTERYKYIRYFDKDNDGHHFHMLTASIEGKEPFPEGEAPIHEELFDLANDPKESENLADDPAHADKLEELRARCRELVNELYGEGPPDTHVRGL